MKKTVIAEVKWIPTELGGRQGLAPKGGRYCPIIRFDGIPIDKDEWSAEIFCDDMDSNLCSIIELSYLFDEAPFENLKLGNSFKLYEGAKLVAEGKIILEK